MQQLSKESLFSRIESIWIWRVNFIHRMCPWRLHNSICINVLLNNFYCMLFVQLLKFWWLFDWNWKFSFSANELIEIISKLKTNCTSGPDGISLELIKNIHSFFISFWRSVLHFDGASSPIWHPTSGDVHFRFSLGLNVLDIFGTFWKCPLLDVSGISISGPV